jgi:cytochrome P450
LGQIIEELDRTKLFNAMLSFSRDKQWNEDGIYLMTFLGFPIVIVNNPAHVKKICITQASKFPKSSNTTGNLSLFMGKGLVTSSGDLWKKQRGLLNNFFSPEPITQMMDKMAYHTNVYLEQWKPDTKGEFEVTDFTSKITELTLRIVIGTYLMYVYNY